MRVRPEAVELLHAARAVVGTVLVPNVADAGREALDAIDRAIACVDDLLARDAELTSADVAALDDARAIVRGAVFDALPAERRYDARLVAKALAVAARQLKAGREPERREYEGLVALLGDPLVDEAKPSERRRLLASLNERLGARIRAGEEDAHSDTHALTLAHLEAVALDALAESNPSYRRRASAAVGPTASTASASPLQASAAAFAAWSAVPRALAATLPVGVAHAPLGRRIDAWSRLRGAVGEAVYASGDAVFAAPVDAFGTFTQCLAANANVPMLAVEGAHQLHDLSAALAGVGTAMFRIVFAPFLSVRPSRPHVTRS